MEYKRMYAILCAACSEAIDALDEKDAALACSVLQEALFKAEDMYIEHADDDSPD